jgi:hypothetical protein
LGKAVFKANVACKKRRGAENATGKIGVKKLLVIKRIKTLIGGRFPHVVL